MQVLIHPPFNSLYFLTITPHFHPISTRGCIGEVPLYNYTLKNQGIMLQAIYKWMMIKAKKFMELNIQIRIPYEQKNDTKGPHWRSMQVLVQVTQQEHTECSRGTSWHHCLLVTHADLSRPFCQKLGQEQLRSQGEKKSKNELYTNWL